MSSLDISACQNQYSLINKDGWLRMAAAPRAILTLPTEILSEIFHHCLPFDPDEPTLLIRPDPEDAPLLLCAVCQRWRHIALATPRLWNSLYLDANPTSAQQAADYVKLCRLWLSRARGVPVAICMDTRSPPKTVASLLDTIVGMSRQWQNVEFVEDSTPQLAVDSSFPYLEKLCISPHPGDYPVHSFLDAPKLVDAFVPFYTRGVLLPWHQLTSFGSNRVDIEDCFNLLRHGADLVNLYLGVPPYGPSILPAQCFSLPRLESLTLVGIDRHVPFSLLGCLKTPALKTLHVGFHYDSDAVSLSDISSFTSFATKSSFQLHTLTLSLIPSTMDAVIECLKVTPSVVDLKLQLFHLIGQLNPLLTKMLDCSFLPKVEYLHIAGDTTCTPWTLLDVLKFRCKTAVGVARVQYLRLASPVVETSKRFVEMQPVYTELVGSGTELYIGVRTYEDMFM
ncbi:hypothetical protein R3P38DRAFT_2904379 [Favolaschia claudopus]|uniref:F-box domain-containing protein n=1 Tax=Favolaschia claudopus TaxID=2862362 RepID=A0AAW0CG24_9AGAR